MTQLAKLALEDGTVFTGNAFGANGEVDGEVCFNTSMTGYQEILTDPSYRGQIVTMTYPEIGNYGVNAEDVESHKPHLAGFIVREQQPPGEQFPRRRRTARLSRPLWHRRHGRHRHPGAGPPHSHPRRDEGRALHDRSRRRQPGGQGQRQPGPGRPRSGARGHSREAGRVERAAQPVDASCTAGEAVAKPLGRLRRTSWRWITA